MPNAQEKLILLGAGPMAEAYAAVLKDMGCVPTVVGRGQASAQRFRDATGLEVLEGGLEPNAEVVTHASAAIVATPVDQLAPNTRTLISMGVKRILVEKPAGLDPETVAEVLSDAEAAGAEVFIAYNRRFLESTQVAKKLIEEDGGATSLRVEFSEFSDRIGQIPSSPTIKENWLYANSTHVLDLGFFLAGFPQQLLAHVQGGLAWHPKGAQFVGHGVTQTNAAFSYHADWDAAPRWMVEVGTAKRTLTLQPLEALSYRDKTGFTVTPVELSGEKDATFKPGLWHQTDAFLSENSGGDLARLADHSAHMSKVYRTILNGGEMS